MKLFSIAFSAMLLSFAAGQAMAQIAPSDTICAI
jgi:hypothetical protein